MPIMSKTLEHIPVPDVMGRSRFGTIFHCFSPTDNSFAACKVIDKSRPSDATYQQCLVNEPKLMTLLSLTLTSSGSSTPTRPATASPSCSSSANLTLCDCIFVVHWDVKPENMLFDSRDALKLAGFGSVAWLHEGGSVEGAMGTPYYAAPEVLMGWEYGEVVDMWRLGVVLYMMIVGLPPFRGKSALEFFEAVLRGNQRFPARAFTTSQRPHRNF
ncbi:hypothetical protein EUGRSUZ_E02371 [Eucalyptus grandis]|uniref:Uncharacterized protein n=2 Tax=Eucalyptus grandis TaxID=71139 RepID=A0ACC3KWT4_EUCGR|nr:hypothetical protein EUGRSUZ_E02371 [Eucalyptus grandis]